jgi:hypothetical protein
MNATTEILQHKIESLTPELLETLVRIVEKLEAQNKFSVPQFQIDEVLYRIEFHNENPKTKLDFYENISELKKYCA